MDMNTILQHAIEYFSAPAFARLVKAMSQRYRNLGRIGGSVRLEKLTNAEREALAGVLGSDLSGKDQITIRLADFQAALEKTRFAGADLVEILQGVTGHRLITRADEQQELAKRRDACFARLSERHSDPLCQSWLEQVWEKAPAARSIHRAFLDDPQGLEAELDDVLRALAHLPARAGVVKRLPVWAAEITGDPHAFDARTNRGKYLLQALQFHGTSPSTSASSTEAQTELLESFGLVRDDILNFVTCTGLLATDDKGRQPKFWQAAARDSAVLNLPVRELSKVQRIYPAWGAKHVFVVENSGVFSDLLDNLPVQSPPLICTHGQFKLASYLLLDKLMAEGLTIWYSGDHDPEGILMAQSLHDRYPKHLKPWRFCQDDYALTISDTDLSERRLKQLDNVTASELQDIVAAVRLNGKAGYQEKLLPSLLQDILQPQKLVDTQTGVR